MGGIASASVGGIHADPTAGYRLKDVAKCLGRDLATVSSLVSRFSERLAEDGRLRKQAERLAEDCQE